MNATKSIAAFGCCILSAMPMAARAQDADGKPKMPQAEEIIVTATRRATNVQKVSATIDVASAEKLNALKIQDAQGLENVVPGITVSRGGGGINPFIRGIGSPQAGFSESPVAVYVDGLYLPNSAGALFSFNDIQRVEVLKGPQGTLYGRNTTGGLINIVTENPGSKTALDASLGYGNFGTFTQRFYGNAPIGSNLAVNVAVFHEKQSEGWSRNVFTGDDVQKSEETGVYGKIRWDAGTGTKVTLSALYNYSNSDKGWAFAIAPGTFGTDGSRYLGHYAIASRTDPSAIYHGYVTSARIDQSLGFADFFSLTGYQWGRQVSSLSQNGIPGQPISGQGSQDVYINFNYKTFSQEFQLKSNSGSSRFDWLVGAFYYHDNTEVTTSITTTCVGTVCAPLPANAPPTFITTAPTTRSLSGYADGTYNVTDSTHLTIGARFTHEKKGFSGLVTPRPGFPNSVTVLPASIVTTPQAAGIPTELTFNKLTFRAVLTQDLTQSARVYASFNRGFRSGTYNPNVVNQAPVLPEVLDAYEAGIKTELFDKHLRLNLSGFYYNYTNLQVRSNAGLPAGAASIAQNVGAASSKGFDVQVDWRPVPPLSIAGGFEYLVAKYDDFPGATCTTPRVPAGAVLGGALTIACSGPKGATNLAGYTLPYSPRYSADLTFSYRMNSPVGELNWVLNNSYKSSYPTVPDNGGVRQGKTLTMDASLNWTSTGKHLYGQLFVRNLTNVYRYATGQSASTFVYVAGAPRTYGFTLGYRL